MADNNSEDKISIASIIAMVCLACLGVITFFGLLFASKSITMAAVVAVVFVAILFFFVKMSIKAKKATDNPDKWQIVGWVCLGLYVITAILPFFMEPFMRFFYVSSQKEELLQAAEKDFQSVESFYSDYEAWRKTKLDNVQARIEAFNSKSDKDKASFPSLNEYVKNIVGSDVSAWRVDADDKTKFSSANFDDVKSEIYSWKRMKIAGAATKLDQLMSSVNDQLAEHQQDLESKSLIPEITEGYEFTGKYSKFDGVMPSNGSQFKTLLSSDVQYSALGIVLYIALHLLVLLYYLSSRGSGVVDIRRDGGVDIDGSTRL